MSNCSDDIIWQVINHQFCAFKITTPQKDSFCKNEYNVTGECSRATCPLANAKYATVRSVDGRIYLYMKTAERQHMPSRWWERIKLSKNYEEALKQIDERLMYWPSHLVDKCKQRLTRLSQIAIAERRMALKDQEREYTVKSKKITRREATRERKALVAAKLEKTIEKELLERLKSGAYGDKPLNVDEKVWNKVLKGVEETEEMQEQEDEQEDESEGEVEFVEDEDEDEDDVVDMEDLERWLDDDPKGRSSGESDTDSEDDEEHDSSDNQAGDNEDGKRKPAGSAGPKPKRRRGHVEIEYEQEDGVRV